MEWVSALAYHMLVVAGVALTAAGSAKLQAHQEPIDKADKMVKAGISILTVAWVALVGWTGLSFYAPRGRNSQLAAAGTVVSLSLLVVRCPPPITNCFSQVVGCRCFCPFLHRPQSHLYASCIMHAETLLEPRNRVTGHPCRPKLLA